MRDRGKPQIRKGLLMIIRLVTVAQNVFGETIGSTETARSLQAIARHMWQMQRTSARSIAPLVQSMSRRSNARMEKISSAVCRAEKKRQLPQLCQCLSKAWQDHTRAVRTMRRKGREASFGLRQTIAGELVVQAMSHARARYVLIMLMYPPTGAGFGKLNVVKPSPGPHGAAYPVAIAKPLSVE